MTAILDLEQRIRTVINEQLQTEVPAADQDLFDNGVLDSLSFVDLLVALEEEFSLQIPLDRINLDDFRSIARMACYISQQQSANEVGFGSHSAV
jgi:acyl carrier protein